MKSSRSDTNNPLTSLDAVKLELAVVLGLVIGVMVVVWRVEMTHWAQLGLLAATGFGAGGWLAWRTKGVIERVQEHTKGQ